MKVGGQYENWMIKVVSESRMIVAHHKSRQNRYSIRLLLSLGTAFVVCHSSMTGVASSRVREISNEHRNYCSSGSIQ